MNVKTNEELSEPAVSTDLSTDLSPDLSSGLSAGRRSFLAVVIGLIGAGITAVMAVTIGRYAVGPALKAGDQSAVWTDAGSLDELPDGVWVKRNVVVSQDAGWGKFNSQRPIWVRRQGQDFTVYSAACPHLGCTINQAASGFICPCHGSAWNPEGQKLAGPSPRNMDSLDYRVQAEILQVNYQYFKQGLAEKVSAS
jgi:menaquinol-cytochrome c reductase iron-sulfur subunit